MIMSVTQRIQQLVSLLKSRKAGVTRADVERSLACSRATAHRMLSRLRDEHGYPLVQERGRYRLDGEAKIELPGLTFRPEELAGLLGVVEWMEACGSGIFREQLKPLRAKLENALREKGIPAREWGERIRLLPMHYRRLDPDVLVAVVDALLRRRRLEFAYKGFSDTEYRRRTVSPQTVVRYRDDWRVDAFDHKARGFRIFVLARMRAVQVLDKAARDIPRPELDAHFAAAYGIFGGRVKGKAVLVFEGEAARIVREEIWHPKQRILDLPDGRFRLEFPCGDVRELARDVMRFADEVVVESPAALRDAVADMVTRAGARRGTR